ncbi:MAG: sulfite exporter TauE/SafE family protein [Holophaga sp.]
MNPHPITFMLTALGAMAAVFGGLWTSALLRLRREEPTPEVGQEFQKPRVAEVLTGFVTMFVDTLGIGSFAITTAIFRGLRLLPDQLIPGTLNAGHSLASILQAFIFTAIIPVDAATLFLMVAAATLGAWFGAGIVAAWPRRRIQAGMGAALLTAACLMLLAKLQWLPPGGTALGLTGWWLALAVAGNLFLGALMTLGIGLFAPCMIMLSFLGMSPKAVFPIMMASCAFLMPVGGLRFIQARSYSPRVALGLTLGGIPAVLIAAFLVKSIPLAALRWIVLVVVAYTGIMLLAAAKRGQRA